MIKLKVCGMREAANIEALLALKPDYVGMIFYPKSKRYVSEDPGVDKAGVKRVGVFVNAGVDDIIEKARQFSLDMIQLHGDESVAEAQQLRSAGLQVMKVFGITDQLPLEQMEALLPVTDYFLFDTKTPGYGGSGRKFNWKILSDYNLDQPFFLSGGIDLEDIEDIKRLQLPQLHAIDINSRFELAPAVKDINKIKALKERL